MPSVYKQSGKLAFCLALLCALFCPLFFPKLHLFYFTPYLVVSLYQNSRIALLWRAFGCGLLIDLLSSGPLFGFFSLNYCLVSWLLYGQTRNFFEDKLLTLSLMTFLFSFLSTAITFIFAFFFGKGYSLSFAWLISDFCVMPLADGAYALLVFSLPFRLIYTLSRMRLFR